VAALRRAPAAPDGKTRYDIVVENPEGNAAAVVAASVDGEDGVLEDGAARIALRRDGATHEVRSGSVRGQGPVSPTLTPSGRAAGVGVLVAVPRSGRAAPTTNRAHGQANFWMP